MLPTGSGALESTVVFDTQPEGNRTGVGVRDGAVGLGGPWLMQNENNTPSQQPESSFLSTSEGGA